MSTLFDRTHHPVGITDLCFFSLAGLQEEELGFPSETGTTRRLHGGNQVFDFNKLSVTAIHLAQTAVRQDAADEAVVDEMVELGHVVHEVGHLYICEVVVALYVES